MNTAHGTLLAGVLTALAGLLLWRYTGGVDLPVVTPSRAGVVLMCVGAGEVLLGAFRAVRATQERPR
ncbi:DUF5708 family protein [Streptomyces sp. NPDC005908]|uniref:DUF5708 family protein n=1 Tax=unclassified Streptomyces TaxID=2593676 RepID=UPI0011A759A8|nr:DUF5708 family protein [Streptomyces sp. T12]TWD21707.1 hypothetical protein FB570_106419 [Streptomyces sp. T12]